MVNIMKKFLFQFKRLVRILSITLVCTASLYGVTGLAPANASFFPQLDNKACLAEYSGSHLTCTANDIQVSEVTNVRNPDGTTPVECVLGKSFDFKADFTIKTTATSRYGYGIWLPEGNWSARDESSTNTCSVISGQTDGPGIDLDGDACADISKKAGNSPVHQYLGETITMFCRDDDNSGKADFNYCASWNQQEYGLCDGDNPTPAGSPSKCRCDTFDIDVFIKPDPPAITKTLTTTNTKPEPGGTYSFDVSFTNPNDYTSIFLTSLYDEVDVGANGTYNESGDASLNLWGPTTTVDATTPEGVYLTFSNCTQPPAILDGIGEIGPSATYSCSFTVHVVAFDLPVAPSPLVLDDVVRLTLLDKNGDPVANGETCPTGLVGTLGQFCSPDQTVQVTNLPPTITVSKTASPTQVPESGATVTYTVRVNNTSATYDSPMQLTSLMDDKFGDLNGLGTCATGGYIAFASYYECSFNKFISGTGAGSHTNTATAKAIDNEADEATNSNSATVQINDIPSAIELSKTANPTSVLETGDNPAISRSVVYTFLFSVKSIVDGKTAVDTVTFSSLTDDMFGDLTANCMVNKKNGTDHGPVALLGFTLDPGENASCSITKQLTGDNGDIHTNEATIDGTDEDGQAVQAMNSATVTFTPSAPASDMDFATRTLVVIRLHNAGIENLTLTGLTVMGQPVVDDDDQGSYVIRNALGGEHDLISFSACNIGEVLGYNGSGTDTYSCAFSIEHHPGLENSTDINFSALLANGIVATLTDDDGQTSSNAVGLEVYTVEP